MSRIYAGSSKPTAIANLKADIATYIWTDANGVKSVNRDGLRAYLQAQLQAVITDWEYVSPATATSAQEVYRTVDVEPIVAALEASIGPDRWASHPDWPTTTDVLTKDQIVATIKAKTSELKKASAEITDYYKPVDNWGKALLRAYYDANAIDKSVPEGVDRKIESRVVFNTFVTDRDEESAPSPASALFDLDQNDSAAYTSAAIPSGRNITKIRWYRSNSNSTGAAFQFVAEVSGGGLSYTDTKKAEELGEECPTTLWTEPRSDIRGFIAGPNGAIAGFSGNRFCPSVNFIPYAFPREYERTTENPIVGLGLFGNTYAVLTTGDPYFATGTDSANLSHEPVRCGQACTALASIVSTERAVYYASPDGICRADASGVNVITRDHFERADWQALDPSTVIATVYEGNYLFQVAPGGTKALYSLNLITGKLVKLDTTGSALYLDTLNDRVYLASGTTIKALMATGTRTSVWKSKLITMPAPTDAAWVQVFSDFAASVQVKVYRDGTLTDTLTVTSNAPVRIKPTRAQDWEIEVTSAARVTSMTVASTTQELKQ